MSETRSNLERVARVSRWVLRHQNDDTQPTEKAVPQFIQNRNLLYSNDLRTKTVVLSVLVRELQLSPLTNEEILP